MKERERFEAWVNMKNPSGRDLLKMENGHYFHSVVEGCWEAWQAATAIRNEAVPMSEWEEVTGLLVTEGLLSRGSSPFTCATSDCPYEGQPTSKNCLCHRDAVREHKIKVRKIIRQYIQEQEPAK